MTENGLTLEKINADRISRLETKVDRVIEMLGKKPNGGGDWKMVAVMVSIVALVGGVLGQNIIFIADRVQENHKESMNHYALYGHPGLMESKAKLEADVKSLDRLFHVELATVQTGQGG